MPWQLPCSQSLLTHYWLYINMSSRFSSNSEADASELQEDLEFNTYMDCHNEGILRTIAFKLCHLWRIFSKRSIPQQEVLIIKKSSLFLIHSVFLNEHSINILSVCNSIRCRWRSEPVTCINMNVVKREQFFMYRIVQNRRPARTSLMEWLSFYNGSLYFLLLICMSGLKSVQ